MMVPAIYGLLVPFFLFSFYQISAHLAEDKIR